MSTKENPALFTYEIRNNTGQSVALVYHDEFKIWTEDEEIGVIAKSVGSSLRGCVSRLLVEDLHEVHDFAARRKANDARRVAMIDSLLSSNTESEDAIKARDARINELEISLRVIAGLASDSPTWLPLPQDLDSLVGQPVDLMDDEGQEYIGVMLVADNKIEEETLWQVGDAIISDIFPTHYRPAPTWVTGEATAEERVGVDVKMGDSATVSSQ